MAFSNPTNFRVDRSTFNDVQGDYNQRIQLDFSQQVNIHGDQDIRNHLYLVMKSHISAAAYHNSGVQREISSCHPGTRKGALKTISDWIENPASHCLWLHGPAGTGKSAIAYTVAERCRVGKTLGATYFFARGSITNDPPLFFPTLAYQLALAVPDLRNPLCTALYEDPTVLDKSMSEQLEKLIVQPLLTLSNQPGHTVIVIDGLDECDCARGPAIQADIVRLVLGLGEHSLPLRFIISSRPELKIRRAFESPCSPLTRLPLDNTMDPDRDIRRFLCDKLGQMYEECVKDGMLVAPQTAWPSSEAIEQLVSGSSGHFIYASTVVKFIREGHADPVERLESVLQIPNESTGPGAFAQSTAFQELDQLYLHILRKAGDPPKLKWILRAIMYFSDLDSTSWSNPPRALVSNIEATFSQVGGIRFLLGDLRSIVEVTESSKVRFFHASMNDFLLDPARSCEFYFDLVKFKAGLAYEYARLIILFSLTESQGRDTLNMALDGLTRCLKDIHTYPGLLSTLHKISIAINGWPRSPLPCIYYSGLDSLLRILKEVPGSGSLQKTIKVIQQRLEPQLVELSGSIFTLVRIIGINDVIKGLPSRALLRDWDIDQLIGIPNRLETVKQTLDLPPEYVYSCQPRDWAWDTRMHISEIYKSLSNWLFSNCRRKRAWGLIIPIVRGILDPPPRMTIEKYTWEWAWDTTVLSPLSWDGYHGVVHRLDLIFCCLRTLLSGIFQPLNSIPEEKMLQATMSVLTEDNWKSDPGDNLQNFIIHPQIFASRIDFPSISQALPALSTELYPRLFYLISVLNFYYVDSSLTDRNPSLWYCLRDVHSHLLQNPIVSRAVSILYALFWRLSSKDIELLLGVAPGELFHLPAMQALFGVDLRQKDDEALRLSSILLSLLRSGSVKLQHGATENYDIDVCISNAHEDLAIVCIEYILSCAEPIKQDGIVESAGSYAMMFWKSHLRCAKHSDRLFEALKRVVIRKDDVELVIEWLEGSTGTPKDVLLRWRAARLEHNTQIGDIPPIPRVLLHHQGVQWSDGPTVAKRKLWNFFT